MDLRVHPIKPKSLGATRKTEEDGDYCTQQHVKRDQGQDKNTEQAQHDQSTSHQATAEDHHPDGFSEHPFKVLQDGKVVVTINKDGLMLRVLLTDRVPYMCPLCGWTFTHAVSLKQHGEDVHHYREPEKMQNGGRGNEIIIAKKAVDQSNILESCFLKDVCLPGEVNYGQLNPTTCNQQKDSNHSKSSTSEKLTTKEGVTLVERVSDSGKLAVTEIVSDNVKTVPKKKVPVLVKFAIQEKVGGNENAKQLRKIAPKVDFNGKMFLKLVVSPKESIKGSSDVRDSSNSVKSVETNLASTKSAEMGATSIFVHPINFRKQADDDIEKQISTGNSVPAAGKPSSDSTTCVASESSLLSDEEDEKMEEEETGSKKRNRRKYRPKCSICGLKCAGTAQRYVHSAEVHGLFRNATEASFYIPKQHTGIKPNQGKDRTQQKSALHKCSHCTSLAFDKEILKRHINGHCGTVDGVKCHLCQGASDLWENGRCEELEALSNKLQEIEDDDQGSGWDRISFSNDGSWHWTEAKSVGSRSVENTEGGYAILQKATVAASDNYSEIQDGDESQADRKRPEDEGQNKGIARTKRKKAYPPIVSKCYECGEKFFFRAHAMNHYHRVHRSITCKDCNTVVPSLNALISHSMQKHKNRGIFRCNQCNQAFHNAGKLHYHLEGHLGLFKCNSCDKSFMTLFALDLHHAKHCPSKEGLTVTDNGFTAGGKRLISCPKCGIEFVRKDAFQKHMSLWHSDKETVTPPKETPDRPSRLICEKCGKSYSCRTSLKTHMQIHRSVDQLLACSFPGCVKMFQSDRNLKIHIQTHHNDREYICKLCGKRLKSRASVKRHRMGHLGVLPFKCHYCGKGFLENKRRLQHERCMHTRHLCKHKCMECGKAYATASGLKTHQNVHSTVKPFNCDTCEASFVDRFSLKSHQRTHTKPFRCEHCAERFAQKGARRRHLSKVHGILEPIERFRTKVITPASSNCETPGVSEDI